MNLKELQKKLQKEAAPQILVLTRDEYCEMYPDQEEDFEPGNYLIVMNDEEWAEENDGGVLDGAYQVTFDDNKFKAIWLPYPEEPYTSIDKFIDALNVQIVDDYIGKL